MGGGLETEEKTKPKNDKPYFCASLELPAVPLGWHKSSVSLAYCICSSSWRMRSRSRLCCFSLAPTLECLWTLAGRFHGDTVRKWGCRASLPLVRDSKVHPLTGAAFVVRGKETKAEVLWKVTRRFVYDIETLVFQSCSQQKHTFKRMLSWKMVLLSVRASRVLIFEKKGSWHNVKGECLEYGKFKSPLCGVLGESPHCYILGFPGEELFHFI